MKDCIKCGIICLLSGMVAGAIVVAKNKKLASVINDGTNKVAQTFTDAKEEIEDKIQEMKESSNSLVEKNNSKKKN